MTSGNHPVAKRPLSPCPPFLTNHSIEGLMKMNKVISWTAYLWLLTVETWEQVVESVRERFFERSFSAAEIRDKKLNDSFRVLPPTVVR